MCDPLTIISGLAMAGSTVAGMQAQRQVEGARNAALQNDMMRQDTLDKETAALNEASRDRYKDFKGEQQERSKSLGDYLVGKQPVGAAPPADAPAETMPTSASNIVTQEVAKQAGKAKDFTDQQGQALGTMRAFGDVLGGISRDTARDAGYLNQTLGFKKGWAGVLPYELEAANQKGAGMKMFGDILGGLGSIGMSAGLGAKPVAAAGSLPSMARPTAVAPLTLNQPNAALPTFARTASLFNPY